MVGCAFIGHCDELSSDWSGLRGLYGCKFVRLWYCDCPIIFWKCLCSFCAGLILKPVPSQTACSTTVSYKMCCILKHNLIILRSLFASQSCLLSGIYCCLQLFTVIYYTLYLLIVVSRMPMRPCLHYMKKIVSLRSIKKYLKSL